MMHLRSLLTLVLELAVLPLLITAYPNWMKCSVELDSSQTVMGADIVDFEETRYKLYVEVRTATDREWRRDYEYDGPTTIQARLKVPEIMEDSSLMFVMESTTGATLNPPVCDGMRSVGRAWDSEVEVKIDGTEDRIDLWAGWARGFEPVKLTKRTILWRQGVERDDDDDDVEEEL